MNSNLSCFARCDGVVPAGRILCAARRVTVLCRFPRRVCIKQVGFSGEQVQSGRYKLPLFRLQLREHFEELLHDDHG